LISAALLVLVGGLAMSNARPDDFPSPRPDPSRIQAAAFADGRLWLLDGAGGLSTIAEHGAVRTAEPLEAKAIALCVQSERLLALDTALDGRWTLRRREAAGWTEAASIGSRGDTFVGMACDATGVSLLTNRYLIDLSASAPRSIGLSDQINHGVTYSLLRAGDQVFVGANFGEFGGGLQRIERRTGKVSQLQRNDSVDPCEAVLDRQCDPVNGLAPAPWNPECIVAAVGLVHMFASGRLVEACGDRLEPLYTRSIPRPGYDRPGKQPFNQVAFFGANRAADTLWVVGVDGLYRFRDRKLVDFAPLPTFKTVGGVEVSFDLPGVVLVKTDINRSVSLSGSVPILVPR
jgi:hypothetical protein